MSENEKSELLKLLELSLGMIEKKSSFGLFDREAVYVREARTKMALVDAIEMTPNTQAIEDKGEIFMNEYSLKNKLNDHLFLISRYINGPFVLAGGAVRDIIMGEKPRDYDCFFNDQVIYNQACEDLDYVAKKIKQRLNSTVFKLKDGTEIDLVYTTYLLDQIHLNFDLHHCCVSFCNGQILKSDMFDIAISDKQLILNVVTYPYLTLSRISKFKNKGWNIAEDQERLILDYCYKAPWGCSKEIEYQNR